MSNRSSWTVRPEILQGELDDAVFGIDFNAVIEGTGPKVYRDAKTLDRNTYPTKRLKAIVEQVFARLASEKEAGLAVRLSTGFGGGKTHTLITMLHLARNIEKDLFTELLPRAGRPKKVTVAAVDIGQAGTPVFAEHKNGITHSLWTEIAYWLNRERIPKDFVKVDEATRQPHAALIQRMFPEGPVLILLDEPVKYLARLDEQAKHSLLAFLDTLVAAVVNRPQTVLVITDPAGQAAYSLPADQMAKALAAARSLGEILGRRVSDYDPIGEETAQVIARRLFERIDDRARQRVSARYLETYQRVAREHPGLIPPEATTTAYAQKIVETYPFHPRLVETAQNHLGGMELFQKSRGVLRLFAKLLRQIEARDSRPDLISAGDLDWTDPAIQGELLDRLNLSEFKAAVREDIQKHALAELDQGQPGLHTRVASALLLESLRTNSRGFDKPELTLAVLRPDESGPEPSEALDRLLSVCWYTHGTAGGSWRFQFDANINRVIEERSGKIELADAQARIQSMVQNAFSGGSFRLAPWPRTARDVADDPKLQLVLCESEELAQSVLANKDTSDEQAPLLRSNRNAILALCPSPEQMNEALRRTQRLLAAEALDREFGADEANKNLREQLKKVMPDEQKRATVQALRAFDKLILPGRRVFRLAEDFLVSEGNVTAAFKGQAQLLDFLRKKGLVYGDDESLGPDFLLKKVLPGATPSDAKQEIYCTENIRDRIYSMPDLQKLIASDGFIRQSLLKAVSAGKLVLRIADGRVFDNKGCVSGQPGQRHRTHEHLDLAQIALTRDVFVTPVGSAAAEQWLREDKATGPKPKPEPRPVPVQPSEAYDWDETTKLAGDSALKHLNLKVRTPADARALIGQVGPLGANQLTLTVSVRSLLKGGGAVNFLYEQLKVNHPLKPLDRAEEILRASEEGASCEIQLDLDFGPDGRANLKDALEKLKGEIPEQTEVRAEFKTAE